jgi:hypothetical protein
MAAGGILVPGGVITIDLNRSWNPILRWILMAIQVPIRGYNWVSLITRDIVITDAAGERELYREGPSNNITVDRPLDALVAEIKRDGLDQFLLKRPIADSSTSPLSISSGCVDRSELTKQSFLYTCERLRDEAKRVRTDNK